MKNTKIENYIFIVKNALSNDLCNSIIEEYEFTHDWKMGVNASGQIKEDYRNCQTINISHFVTIQKNKDVRQKLDNDVFQGASKCIIEYNAKFPHCQVQQDNGYELLRYLENGFCKQHIDSCKKYPRAVSCSFALNNDFEGGEFVFFDRELKYKLEKGDALMFPSNFMYPHEVMPVTKGTRYSIVTWFI
jgi:predicted 2-oxoglutarate/Fe(II)-dependent dioxygenase YbiX